MAPNSMTATTSNTTSSVAVATAAAATKMMSEEVAEKVVNQERQELLLLQELRLENGQLEQTTQALKAQKLELLLETEALKGKAKGLEQRLLESMQARAAREQSFQQEIKRQRDSMNTLFHDLADSKLQASRLQKQLQETNTKLRLQQELTANLAFQQEQEEDDDEDDGTSIQEDEKDEHEHQQHQQHHHRKNKKKSSSPRPPIGSRLGTFFSNRRRSNNKMTNENINLTSSSTEEVILFGGNCSGSSSNEEEGKMSLPEIDYATTMEESTSSSTLVASPGYEGLPQILIHKIIHDEPLSPRIAAATPTLPSKNAYTDSSSGELTRLEQIRQKRRSLENLWRKPATTATATTLASPTSMQQSWFGNASRKPIWNQQLQHESSKNNNLVRLMNRQDD